MIEPIRIGTGGNITDDVVAWEKQYALLSSENEKLAGMVKEKDDELARIRKAVKEQGARRKPVPATPLRSQADALAFDMSVPCGRDHYDIRDDFEKLLNALTHHREAAKEMADALSVASACIAYWMPDETAVERRFHAAWVHDRAFVKQIDGILSKFTAPTPPAPAVEGECKHDGPTYFDHDEPPAGVNRCDRCRVNVDALKAESRGYERGKAEALKSDNQGAQRA